jgi:hypothetical protein
LKQSPLPAGGEAVGGTVDLDLEVGVDRLVLQLAPAEAGLAATVAVMIESKPAGSLGDEETVRPSRGVLHGGRPGGAGDDQEPGRCCRFGNKRTSAGQCTETEVWDAPKAVDYDPTEAVVEVDRLVRLTLWPTAPIRRRPSKL